MSENEFNEPLMIDVDLSTVETTRPILVGSLYDLRICGFSKEPSKKAEGAFNLKVEFQTVDPATSITGKEIPSGHKLWSYYPLQNKVDAKNNFDYKVNLAALQEAALGEKKTQFDTRELIGQVVRATIKVTQYEGTDSNEIGRLSQAV